MAARKRFDKIRNNILNFIKKTKVITTSEMAEKFKISWNTAERYLTELVLEKKVQRIRKAGVNLWVLR